MALESARYDEAHTHLTGALHEAASDAERARVLNKRGVACIGLGQKMAALEDFITVLELVPAFAPTVVNIGNMLLEDHAVDEAIEHYTAALRIDESYAYAHRNLAVAYRRAGRRSEAVRSLRAALRYEQGAWWRPWQRGGPKAAR